MSNVIEYLLQLSQEQKAMFQSMSDRVDDMEDHVKVILIRVQEVHDKLGRGLGQLQQDRKIELSLESCECKDAIPNMLWRIQFGSE